MEETGRRRRVHGRTRTAPRALWVSKAAEMAQGLLERPVPVDEPSAMLGDVLVLAFLGSAYAYFQRRKSRGKLHGATSEAVPSLILLGVLGGFAFKFASYIEAELVFASVLAAYYGFVLATAAAQRQARHLAKGATGKHEDKGDTRVEGQSHEADTGGNGR